MYQFVLIIGVIVAAPAPKEAPKKDLPTIVGDWVPSSMIVGGMPDKVEPGMMFTLAADGKCFMKEGNEKPEEMSYTIDPKKDPAHIDLREPGMQGELMKGIYKLDGETLTVCLGIGGDRPAAFVSPAKSNVVLITLKRAKKE